MKLVHSETHIVEKWNNEEITISFNSYLNHVNREIGRRYRAAVIVCPGGAYAFRSDTEGEYVAIKFQACGYQSFLLNYSVDSPFPRALFELASLIKHIRENSDLYDVNPERIFICGFSAGGHLAGQMGTLWNSELFIGDESYQKGYKPDGLILCYPVITDKEHAHRETISNLTNGMKEEYKKYISIDDWVTNKMPPVFVWHTVEDNEVPVENTLLLIDKLRKNNVSFECHLFEKGPHGLSLGTEYTAVSEDHINVRVAKWFEMADAWVRSFNER